MSIIKAKLQEKNAEFISIREVLELLSQQGDGCTMEEAALYLMRRLQEFDAPEFVKEDLGRLIEIHKRPGENVLATAINGTAFLSDEIPF